jgi:hypothetical protein
MIARGERPLFRPRTEPDGKFILIRIPELDLVTEVLTRADVAAMARGAIAVWLDVPGDSFDVEVEQRR